MDSSESNVANALAAFGEGVGLMVSPEELEMIVELQNTSPTTEIVGALQDTAINATEHSSEASEVEIRQAAASNQETELQQFSS